MPHLPHVQVPTSLKCSALVVVSVEVLKWASIAPASSACVSSRLAETRLMTLGYHELGVESRKGRGNKILAA
jgi:hypothetical protein